ncbi:MAG: CHAT domain-containing protein [Gammaproteobacteria bacterium]
MRRDDPEDEDGVLPGMIGLDERFDDNALVDALQLGYPVVHIASHFRFVPGNERDSFLLLGSGKRLTLEQVNVEDYNFGAVDLLTLSACETAMGGAGADGKEVEGFGTLAQKRGAKGVLATLWSVADESTGAFMRQMYRFRAEERLSKAEAIRRTQLAFIRGDAVAGGEGDRDRGVGVAAEGDQANLKAPYAHPYYWAPFILMGNWL